jgi:ribonuclease HI
MFIHYPDHTVVFTDGSLMKGSVGCAFILNGNTFKFQVNSFSSTFTAELLAFSKVLQAVRNLLPGKFPLCLDSLSAIQGLQSPDFTHPLIVELCTTYHTHCKQDFRITLAWIPGHVGIGGKAADTAARDATTHGSLVPGVSLEDCTL